MTSSVPTRLAGCVRVLRVLLVGIGIGSAVLSALGQNLERYTQVGTASVRHETGQLGGDGVFYVLTSDVSSLGVDAEFLAQLALINGRAVLPPMLFDAWKAQGLIPNWVRSTAVYPLGSREYAVVCVQGACDPNAPFITEQPRSLTVFEGASASFTVRATGEAPLRFQWRRNGTPIDGATLMRLAFPEAVRADAGTYDVVVSNGYGVTHSLAAGLTITNLPHGTPWAWLKSFGLRGDPVLLEIADPDGDGQACWEEYVAGTNPTNSSSVLRIIETKRIDQSLTLTFPTQTGRTYRLEGASDPGVWQTLIQEIHGDGANATAADPSGLGIAGHRIYRVAVARSPIPNPDVTAMVLIPAGDFAMGNTFSGEGDSDELPLHTNQIGAFYMDKYEVTKALWDDVCTWAAGHGYSLDNAGSGRATNHPVHSVSWYDAVKWCNARSEREGRVPAYYTSAAQTVVYRSGQVGLRNDCLNWNAGYRLPTEAEWEKAARGGVRGHRFSWTDADTIDFSRANYCSYSGIYYDTSPIRGHHPSFAMGAGPVGYFAASGYGLYDMTGNVWEWCWDWYGSYRSSSASDPHGPVSGSFRVFRGGSWYADAMYCRLAIRGYYLAGGTGQDLGFRCVLPTGPP
jgi:formylglycine-generating enzyme required for sulfatase activity